MKLFNFSGRKAKTSGTEPESSPEVMSAETTFDQAAADPVAKTRHRALALIEDDFLHRQLDEVFSQSTDTWTWERAGSVACARQLLAKDPYSVIISQSEIAGDSVVDLFNDVVAHKPGTLRFFFGQKPSPAMLKQLRGSRPSVISSKARPEMVLEQFEREILVDSWLTNSETRKRIATFRNLPSIPTIYNRVIAELESTAGSFDEVAKLIAQDPLMTAKVLQVVNSALFALSSTVTKPEEAVLILGAERTKALVLAVPIFTAFNSEQCPGISPEQIWQHSMDVATLSRCVAISEKSPTEIADAAFTAGLLHDVGKLLLAANMPKEYADTRRYAEENGTSSLHAEQRKLGMSHAEVAACLFGTWGLPIPVLEAIAHHHCPAKSDDSKFTPLTAVHVGNALFYERRQSNECVLDAPYLKRIGLLDHRNQWRTSVGIAARPEEAGVKEKMAVRRESRNN